VVKSLYLTQMESWVRKYQPSLGISSANACIGKLLDLMSDDGNKQNSRAHTKFNTGSEIFVIAKSHCLYAKLLLHAGLHDTLHMIQHVILWHFFVSNKRMLCNINSILGIHHKYYSPIFAVSYFAKNSSFQNFVSYGMLSDMRHVQLILLLHITNHNKCVIVSFHKVL